MAGTASLSGQLAYGAPNTLILAPTGASQFKATLAVSGDLALTFGVRQLAPTGIAGSLGRRQPAFVAPFTLVQTSPLDIAGAPP